MGNLMRRMLPLIVEPRKHKGRVTLYFWCQDDSDELEDNGNTLLGDPIDLQKTFRNDIRVERLQHTVNK